MGQAKLCALMISFSAATLMVGLPAGLPPASAQTTQATDAERLANEVEDLGSNRFRVREAAFQKLVGSGAAAIEALEAGTRSDDVEVSNRCIDALVRIAADDACFQQVIDALDRLASDPTNPVAQLAKTRSSDLKLTDEDRAVAALTRAGARIYRGSSGKVSSVSLSHDGQTKWLKDLDGLRTVRGMGRNITDKGVRQIAKVRQMSSLTLLSCPITDAALVALRDCQSLRRLSFSSAEITPDGIRELRPLPSLSSLAIFSPVDEEFLQVLTELPRLDSVYLSKLQLSARVSETLNQLTHLRRVSITVTGIDDERAQWLADIDIPIQLSIDESPKLSETGWNHLARSRLVGLTISDTPITDADLVHIGKLNLLETLNIRRADITDAGLIHLHQLRALKMLDLSEVKATQDGVDAIKKALPNLVRVSLRNSGNAPLAKPAVPPRTQISFTGDANGRSAHIRVNLTEQHIAKLKQEQNLETVFLTGGTATDQDLALLADAPMKGLVIDSSNVSSVGFKALKEHATLKSVSLWSTSSASSINDDALVAIGDIPLLQRLIIKKAPITDAGLAKLISRLAEAGKIESLSLYSCPKISDQGFQGVGQLKTLERLYLTGNMKVKSGMLESVSKLTGLQSLTLEHLQLDEADLAKLASLSNVKSLDLTRGDAEGALTNVGLKHVTSLKSLESLSVNDAAIDDDGLSILSTLTDLRTLSLSGTKITDAGLATLVEQHSDLESLYLTGTDVTDAGMKHVGKLKKLRVLRVEATSVGDEGLRQLAELSALKIIYVEGPNLSADAHRQFRRTHPDTRITLN